ncbi:DUF4214 domain-containing protein [Spiribacter aquaticus]|uniref:DUF4214 domain-containing protein n=1 Tax=Spiribacter aquaticus TaxID=1935996 RepID=A0A557RGN6_9GAMM|nr:MULTISPECIES: DUF4214 domain-containing protein [Spiribacter]KAF0280923.1 hypothetical protein BA897_09820 [Spiribacter roseus]TVO64319.1 DUF4214 domain-containing protein [Spiribacter aquaticus]
MDDGAFELSRIHEDMGLGNARDYAPLDAGSSGADRLVVVDHGLEPSGGYASWPHGHIYVATLDDAGTRFEQVTDDKAFYHSVSAGDINGDGRMDIVASHMRSNFGATPQNINVFIQNANGGFTEDLAVAEAMGNSGGTGAVVVTDRTDAGNDILEVAYGDTYGEDYAARVFSGDVDSGFEISHRVGREGLFETMGGTRIRAADLDLDGSKELVTSLEGTLTAHESGYTANGLEVFSQGPDGEYQYSTDVWLEQNAWRFETLQFREFEIVDFDHDGFLDLVLNGWNGSSLHKGGGFDVGSLLFRNDGEGALEQLDTDAAAGLVSQRLPSQPEYMRVIPAEPGEPLELFAMLQDGSTHVLSVEAAYRNEDEVLNAAGDGTQIFGRGGDDEFLVQGASLEIDGGAGLDEVIYNDRAGQHRVERQEDQWSVTDSKGEADRLTTVERLQFEDQSLGLDLDGASGQAYRLYQAAFDRAPDPAGLGYWIAQVDDGMALEQAAARFIDSSEFQDLYGQAPDDAAFLTALYGNVLDRAPDSDGYVWWLSELQNNPAKTREKVLMDFSESPENRDNVAEVIATGIEYDAWA